MPIVQFYRPGHELLTGAIPHTDVLGKKMSFYEVLSLIANSRLYIGTDSWPGHAAIYQRAPSYILLKGAVSKRWDHKEKYSDTIREGNCQFCERFVSHLGTCAFNPVEKECMKLITVEKVIERIDKALNEDRKQA
jgi:ADP-heptose:LPS heptosyltransferase